MAIGRPMPPVILDEVERETLVRWVRRPKTAQALALRARMILGCAEGRSNTTVGADLGVSDETVGKWRSRFLERRLDGLSDEPRSGRPRAVTDDHVERVITLTLETTPKDATHWSTRSMAQRSGLSHNTVSRIWRCLRIAAPPHGDLQVVGRPLLHREGQGRCGAIPEPPDRALVLCVDEKSQIQALDRTRPLLPMRPGQVERRTHDYLRHGTTSLFAALDTRTGKVIGRCHQRHRAVEFRKFLDTIEAEVPAVPRRPPDRGQLRHPQDGADPQLAGQAAPLPYALHTHQRLLAEPGGALVRSAHRKAVAPWRASEQRRTGGCHLPLSGRHQRRSPTFCLDPDRRPNTGQRCPLLPTYFGYRTLGVA